jgi:hypothetical protein
MPDLENTGTPAGPAAGPEPGTPSRRAVLRGAAGAGAAGIAVATLGGVAAPVPAAARAQTHDPRTPLTPSIPPDTAAAGEDIVVHVRDAAAGQLDVFRGTTQTRLQDRDLAARLVRASR